MENYQLTPPSELIHEREYHVSLILSAERLKERWELIGYEPPKPKQLQLFETE